MVEKRLLSVFAFAVAFFTLVNAVCQVCPKPPLTCLHAYWAPNVYCQAAVSHWSSVFGRRDTNNEFCYPGCMDYHGVETFESKTYYKVTHLDKIIMVSATDALQTFDCNKPRTCDKIHVLAAALHHEHVESMDAHTCPDGTHSQSEAVLMKYCNLTASSNWIQGQQVMKYCTSMLMYTPVSTFTEHVNVTNRISGVFVGCITGGFKMISQSCGGNLHIASVTESNSQINADWFYMVL